MQEIHIQWTKSIQLNNPCKKSETQISRMKFAALFVLSRTFTAIYYYIEANLKCE